MIYNCMHCSSSHERRKCPAFKKKCSKCGKLNHFARVCRSGGNDNGGFKNKLHSLESMNPTNYAMSEDEDDAYIAFLGNCAYSKYLSPTGEYFVGSCSFKQGEAWSVKIDISGVKVTVKLDTGADVSVLNYRSYRSLCPSSMVNKPTKILRTANGVLDILGVVTVDVSFKNKCIKENFYVLQPGNNTVNLLGRNACCNLGIIKFVQNINIDSDLFGFGK